MDDHVLVQGDRGYDIGIIREIIVFILSSII